MYSRLYPPKLARRLTSRTQHAIRDSATKNKQFQIRIFKRFIFVFIFCDVTLSKEDALVRYLAKFFTSDPDLIGKFFKSNLFTVVACSFYAEFLEIIDMLLVELGVY